MGVTFVVDVEASFETGEFQCLLIQSLLHIIALRVVLECKAHATLLHMFISCEAIYKPTGACTHRI